MTEDESDTYGAIKTFGYDLPGLERVPVPVGFLCFWCDEPIEAHHRGTFMVVTDSGDSFRPLHMECNFLSIIGSAEHQQSVRLKGLDHECGPACYESEHRTKRQNALRAYYFYSAVRVHILEHGFALCRFDSRVPGQWPMGHRWTGIDEPDLANCDACKAALASRVS